MSVCQSVCLSACLSIVLSVCLSICLSVCLPVYLSLLYQLSLYNQHLYIHVGNSESGKTLEQKCFFQIGTLNPIGTNERFSFY